MDILPEVFKSGIVRDPTIKVPEAFRLMSVPPTVIAGPPAEMVRFAFRLLNRIYHSHELVRV